MVGFIIENEQCYAGKHLLIDLYECQNHGNLDETKNILIDAAKATGATVLFCHLHPFDDGGLSGVVMLAESHLSLHWWEEDIFACIDIFVCGTCDPYLAFPILEKYFQPKHFNISLEKRGININK